MAEVVLRNSKLPGQLIVVPLPDGGEVSPEYEAAGWHVAKTDPDKVADLPTVPPEDKAVPVSNPKEK